MVSPAFRRMMTLAIVLALAGAASLASITRAADHSDVVNVTASIESLPISITLCDTTADFGTGLDANGSLATSPDAVVALAGDEGVGEGAFYQWTPSCGVDEAFITVVSGNPWTGAVCAVQNTSTSTLTLDNLRFSPVPFSNVTDPYGAADTGSKAFASCPSQTPWLDEFFNPGTIGGPGVNPYDLYYYLKVDRTDIGGTFTATTTWSVTG